LLFKNNAFFKGLEIFPFTDRILDIIREVLNRRPKVNSMQMEKGSGV
jgi:hypothetical protein